MNTIDTLNALGEWMGEPRVYAPDYVHRPRSIDLTQLTPQEREWLREAKAQMDADLDAAEARS